MAGALQLLGRGNVRKKMTLKHRECRSARHTEPAGDCQGDLERLRGYSHLVPMPDTDTRCLSPGERKYKLKQSDAFVPSFVSILFCFIFVKSQVSPTTLKNCHGWVEIPGSHSGSPGFQSQLCDLESLRFLNLGFLL
jgi:hypothetical protein